MQGLENFSLWQSLNYFKTTLFLGMNLSIKVKLTKYKLSPKKKQDSSISFNYLRRTIMYKFKLQMF